MKMRERYQRFRIRAQRVAKATPSWFLVIVLMLATVAGGVAAQELIGNWEDDFENGNADGWQGENIEVVNDSVEGTYSMRAEDGLSAQDENPEWVQGPVIDLNREFTVRGTSKIDQGGGNYRAGFGIVRPIDGNAEGVILLFSDEYGATFIARTNLENPNDNNLETIPQDFENTWVNWEFTSDGNGTVQAKVWEDGTTEPESYQITREMEPDSGSFSVFAGTSPQGRQVYLDSVRINGSEATDPTLSINTRQLFKPGDTHSYEVREIRKENNQNVSVTVTDNASVRSLNESVLTHDAENNTFTANESASAQTVLVRAQYNGSVAYQEVVVGESSVENLDILPTATWRINAVIGDSFFQALLVALFISVAVTRYTSAFGGLASGQMVLVLGWFGGYVSWAMAAVSLFVALFIGLNLAANIDYSVRK